MNYFIVCFRNELEKRMVNNRKYPKLTGVCEKAIQNQWCLGCQKVRRL